MSPFPASKSARARSIGPGRSRGVGLIEVLVAVLVLSIGLLGIALVQTRALSQDNSSMSRSMAVVASYSIIDAMRIDQTNALAGSYNTTMTADACPDAGSTLAGAQLHEWCEELGAALGTEATTQGTVTCATDGTDICEITVQFDDSRIGTGGSSAQQVITKVML
ncbi:MAG: type IV pilus modification protein PilV [Solimonas sp.]